MLSKCLSPITQYPTTLEAQDMKISYGLPEDIFLWSNSPLRLPPTSTQQRSVKYVMSEGNVQTVVYHYVLPMFVVIVPLSQDYMWKIVLKFIKPNWIMEMSMSNFFGFHTVPRLYLDGIFMLFQCFITFFTYHSY